MTQPSIPSGPHAWQAKLLELRSLIETARWSLLDAVIMVNELYEAIGTSETASADARELFEPEPNHEDYIPGGDAS